MKTTLYQTILNHYKQEILEERLKPGDQIPTELQISEKFKVSRITAMRAVKELEQLGMVSRMKKRGTLVNEKSEYAESKANLQIISMIIPFSEQIGFDLIRGAEEAAKRYGCYVTYHCSHFKAENEREIVLQLMKDKVRGIIVYPCKGNLNLDLYSSMLIERFPFVVVDRKLRGLEVPLVTSSNYQGAYDITNYLIGLGHRRIAFLSANSEGVFPLEERFRGYTQALIHAQIPLKQEWIQERSGGEKQLEQQFLELMHSSDAPTAIVAANDMQAISLLKIATQTGFQVPDQLSITGFDNLPVTGMLDIPLTTMQQPFVEIGAHAVDMLFTVDSENRAPVVELSTRLIERASTAPPLE